MKTLQYYLVAALFVFLATASLNNVQAQKSRTGANTNTNSNTSSGTKKTNTNTNTNTNTGTKKGKVIAPKSVTPPPANTNTNTNTNKKSTTSNQKPKSSSKTGVFFGGGVNTTTDGKNFMIDAQPYIGYRMSPQIQFTAGPVYQYQGGSTPLNLFGARASSRVDITSGVYAMGMFEGLYYKQGESNKVVTRLPLGAGYSHNLFGVGANISVMYDVLYNKSTSPYASPFVISGGINIGGGSGFNFGSKFNMDDVFKNTTNKK